MGTLGRKTLEVNGNLAKALITLSVSEVVYSQDKGIGLPATVFDGVATA